VKKKKCSRRLQIKLLKKERSSRFKEKILITNMLKKRSWREKKSSDMKKLSKYF